MKKDLKKLTILHSNDLHGDFFAEEVDKKLVGGVSRLSGYVNKVRNEEKNVLYAIAGDMFRGSLIDSEYQGISTIDIMNMLAPDVVSLGNHEVDYGLSHLLFLEKCASFPIVCANMYLKYRETRLFQPHWIKRIGGMRVLFIGILTEEVLASTKTQGWIGTLVDLKDAVEEVGKICDAYRTKDIDLTVLLTHIGFEKDQELAAALDPAWGVDIIIGGHTHTLLSEPCVVSGIPIVQAAVGTDQIGRFDITIDTDKNCIDSYTWQCIPITEENCPRDMALEKELDEYKNETDKKYNRVLTRFPRAYTHPQRNMETELGNLMADGMREMLGVDLMFVGSGSIRRKELGPIVTLKDFTEIYPFNSPVFSLKITGEQLRRVLKHMLREEAFVESGATEWYQFSKGFYCEYDRPSQTIQTMKMNGNDIADDDVFTIGLEEFHYMNIEENLGVPLAEVEKNGAAMEVATKAANVLQEFFNRHDHIEDDDSPRLVLHDK